MGSGELRSANRYEIARAQGRPSGSRVRIPAMIAKPTVENRLQAGLVEWLGKVIVHACFEIALFVLGKGVCRQCDDRRRTRPGGAARIELA